MHYIYKFIPYFRALRKKKSKQFTKRKAFCLLLFFLKKKKTPQSIQLTRFLAKASQSNNSFHVKLQISQATNYGERTELNRTIREICARYKYFSIEQNKNSEKLKTKSVKMYEMRCIVCWLDAEKWVVYRAEVICLLLFIHTRGILRLTIYHYHSLNRMNRVKFWFVSSHTSNHNIMIFLCLDDFPRPHFFTPWWRASGFLSTFIVFSLFCGMSWTE